MLKSEVLVQTFIDGLRLLHPYLLNSKIFHKHQEWMFLPYWTLFVWNLIPKNRKPLKNGQPVLISLSQFLEQREDWGIQQYFCILSDWAFQLSLYRSNKH